MLERRRWLKILYSFSGLMAYVILWDTILSPPTYLGTFRVNTDILYTQYDVGFSFPIRQLSVKDYSRLINLTFNFSILNLVCTSSSPLLLILIHTSPRNFARRKTIRETWGLSEENVKILFVLGMADSIDLQTKLEKENKLYHDFIQGNFVDSYKNMTYKHVMIFKYVIYHCPKTKYVLKTDDDVFVNMPLMKNFLVHDLSPYGARDILSCTTRSYKLVPRSHRSKWRLPVSDYSRRYYPCYCPGWILLYSPDVIFALYEAAQTADYFWIDDLHITGTLAEELHIIHTDIEPLVISEEDLRCIVNDFTCRLTKAFLFGRANLGDEEIRALWEFVTTHSAPQSVYEQYKYLR